MAEEKRTSRVGIIVTIALVVAGIFVYRTFMTPEPNDYVVVYNNVNGLQASSPVMLKGVRIGKIKSIDLEKSKLKVVLSLEQDIVIKQGAKAMLASAGLLGDKTIIIENGQGASLPRGSQLWSGIDTTAMETSVQVTPYLVTAKYLLRSADSTLQSFTDLSQAGLLSTFINPLIGFEKNMVKYVSLSEKLNKQGTSIGNSLHNIYTSSNELAASSQQWPKKLDTISQQTASFNQSAASIDSNLKSLSNNFKSISAAASGKTVRKYANDKSTYVDANKSLDSVNTSMKELQQDPPGFSIFGKSKKKKKK